MRDYMQKMVEKYKPSKTAISWAEKVANYVTVPEAKELIEALLEDTMFVSTPICRASRVVDFIKRTGTQPSISPKDWWVLRYCDADNQETILKQCRERNITDETIEEAVSFLLSLEPALAKELKYIKAKEVEQLKQITIPEWVTTYEDVECVLATIPKLKRDGLPLILLDNEAFCRWCELTIADYLLVPRYLVAPNHLNGRFSEMWEPFTENFDYVRIVMSGDRVDFDFSTLLSNLDSVKNVLDSSRDYLEAMEQWYTRAIPVGRVLVVAVDHTATVQLTRG